MTGFVSFTADDVERAARDERENVEAGVVLKPVGVGQFLNQNATLLVEHVDKVLQDLGMEGRRQHFAPRVPLATYEPMETVQFNETQFLIPRSDQ